MRKSITIILFFFFVATCNLFAQSKEDVVYLNNGSILRGKVIETIKGVQTSIEISGRNVIVIPDSAVKMIQMDQAIPAKERGNKSTAVEMTASANFYGGSTNTAGFTFITSYRFPFRLAVGAGIGIEWFDRQQIPFIADFKYYFLRGSWSPYIYGQGGYAVPLSQEGDNEWTEYHGGALAGGGAGMRFNFTNRNALIFSIGYRYQKTETITNPYPYSSYYPQYETIRVDEFNRLSFAFGFVFN